LSLVGPKARPHGVADGSQVDIPEPGIGVEPAGTLRKDRSQRWLSALWRLLHTSGTFGGSEADWKRGREKPQRSLYSTVPQTDTGGHVEDTKAFERTLAKELGKMTP